MFRHLLLDHPRSAGETYFVHQRMAFGFAGALLAASAVCFIHGLVPGLFQRTGSGIVARLHERMAARGAAPAPQPNALPRRGRQPAHSDF